MEITNDAKAFIDGLLAQHEAENIKVFMNGDGCCGPSIALAIDEPAEQDVVEEINGVKVAFEKGTVEEAKVITLDFQRNEEGGGLVLLGANECC